MFVKFCRKWFGGVRFFLTITILQVGVSIIYVDLFTSIQVSGVCYAFLGGILGQVTIFQLAETKRKSLE